MIGRREFITMVGGVAVAWPIAARAQQPAMPVIGFLAGQSREGRAYLTAALKQGLSETGYFEGQNASIEYRWAENQYDRLPEMAAELVNRKVAVIVAGPVPAALAAKAATADIPIVFAIGGDPVKSGLVASLNRPDGNVTGVSFFTTTLEPKRLELLQEVAPNVAVIAMLLNPKSLDYENQVRDVQAAAHSIGQQIVVLNASSERDIEIAFATIAQQRVGAILIGSDPFFTDRRSQLVALAAHHGIAAIYQWREFAEAGGLMSYGTSLTDAYRSVGVYAGRILKGTKSADLLPSPTCAQTITRGHAELCDLRACKRSSKVLTRSSRRLPSTPCSSRRRTWAFCTAIMPKPTVTYRASVASLERSSEFGGAMSSPALYNC